MILREKFSPTCFLSALGAGGLSVSFFMYLMFLVPHPTTPMATFEYIMEALEKGDAISFISSFALVFIIAFAILHFKLLYWNTKQYLLYKKSDAYKALIKSNGQISIMALPLTYTMSINVGFVLSAVFLPYLCSFVEYLFSFALIVFAINGYFALKIFFDYFSRLIINGDFDFTKNNNLTQMISIFALAMVAVGFAAPGAMSSNIAVDAVGIYGAIIFSSLAVNFIFIKIHIVFGILGLVIMKKLGYFEKFIKSNEKSALSFALICPGVAFFVFGMFFINLGLTYNEIITKYSVVYYLLMVPFIYVQIKTIVLFFRLYKKFSF